MTRLDNIITNTETLRNFLDANTLTKQDENDIRFVRDLLKSVIDNNSQSTFTGNLDAAVDIIKKLDEDVFSILDGNNLKHADIVLCEILARNGQNARLR